MSELQYDEWMSESDSVLWHIERDPLLRSTIASVWILDSVPDRDRMDEVLQRVVDAVPRLRQRVVDRQPGVSTPRWEDDPWFDADYHYQWVRLPGRRVGERDVLDHAQRLASRAFDKDRPLWELTVIEGLTGKRAAFVMKIHHAIADGLGMVQLLQHMVDLEADPAPDASARPVLPPSPRVLSPLWAIPGSRSLGHRLATEARTSVRLGKASLRTASGLIRSPRDTITQLGRTTGSIARVVMPATTPLSPLMTERSLHTHFAMVTAPFGPMKAAGKSVGGTLNDAFVAATLVALDRYHRAQGAECSQIRMNMPVSVRAGDRTNQFDNQFVPTRMVLPVGHADASECMAAVKDILREVRAEPALPHVNDISGVISRLGPAASVSVLGAMLKGVDITTSNVPGPPFPVYMAGARVTEFLAFGPLAGAAVNITLFSYDGTVHLGINMDRAAIPDGDLFVRCIRDALAEVIALAGEPVDTGQDDTGQLDTGQDTGRGALRVVS
jgi:diacylglycerol O-acyltransferase / wax synthase